MKLCLCCHHQADDAEPTCPKCGEASFGASTLAPVLAQPSGGEGTKGKRGNKRNQPSGGEGTKGKRGNKRNQPSGGEA